MLRFNNIDRSFFLETDDTENAEKAGLTLSKSIRGANGEKIYYTADYNKAPEYNPYAVLPFWKEADSETRNELKGLIQDYKNSWAESSDEFFPCPIDRAYKPFQIAGIANALKRTNVIIGDEPGLGKTIQGIGLANAINAKKILVICPANVRLQWAKQARDWSVLPDVRTYVVAKKKDGVCITSNYVICSYNLASTDAIQNALCDEEWDLLILDEAHYLKSIEAKRSRAVFGGGKIGSQFAKRWIAKKSKRILALTGTLLPNRPRECYNLVRNLDWEAIDYMSYDAFLYRYNPRKFIGETEEFTGRLLELQARLRCNLLTRRLKDNVEEQLPDKTYEISFIQHNGKITKALKKEALIDFDPMQLFNPHFNLEGTPVSTLRREMGEAKVPRIVEHVKYLLDVLEIPKIILFYHHKSVRELLIESLQNYGIVGSYGGQSPKARDLALQEFVEGSPKIWLAQLGTVAGTDGLQQICSYMVFGEPDWTHGGNEQCVDRCHRIGQHDNVIAQFPVVQGSMDEKVLNAVLFKSQTAHQVLDKELH
jgi:SWI/SNF-related matrix-associated actin-dependent regulator 1 of chromatin subfamily A